VTYVAENLLSKYKEMLKRGISIKNALDILGYKRYCCRRMIFTHGEIPII
jgi:DNA-directed RNA polymerase subunit N (RpoN/RPB10)